MGYLLGIHKQVNDLLKFHGTFWEYRCTFSEGRAHTFHCSLESIYGTQDVHDYWRDNCLYLPGWGGSMDAGLSVLKLGIILGKLGQVDHLMTTPILLYTYLET